jgi:hypothetical protein
MLGDDVNDTYPTFYAIESPIKPVQNLLNLFTKPGK